MKVLFVITNLSVGGAENMLFKILLSLDRNNISPVVVSLVGVGDIGSRIQLLGVPVIALGMTRGLPSPLGFLRLVKLMRQLRPRIVHTWMYHSDFIGGVAARLVGIKRVIWCIRHADLSRDKNKRSTLMVVKACAMLSRWVPARIISCSHRARDTHILVGYDANKMHVIPNGFDLSSFVPNPQTRIAVRRELGVPLDVPVVGLVARFDRQKNHSGFIAAAALVRAQLPDAQFVFAGTGVDSDNKELVNAISAARLDANVHLLGRRDDVPRLMASLDVLASSSDGEGFPNVLGEAMACGVPCVVTDVGDSAEIVGDTGRVVEPGDMVGLANGLIELLRMPKAQRDELGERARARISSNYEIGAVTRMYESFYEEVASSGRSG